MRRLTNSCSSVRDVEREKSNALVMRAVVVATVVTLAYQDAIFIE